ILVQAIDAEGTVAGGAMVQNAGEPEFYEILNLPAGDYTIRYLGQNSVYESQWWDDSLSGSGAQVITLLPNETRNSIDATLEVGGSITSSIDLPADVDPISVYVYATTLDGSFSASSGVAPNGTYS